LRVPSSNSQVFAFSEKGLRIETAVFLSGLFQGRQFSPPQPREQKEGFVGSLASICLRDAVDRRPGFSRNQERQQRQSRYTSCQTHFSYENCGIAGSESLDDPADGVDLACDRSSGEFLYELIDSLSTSPWVVEWIGVPANARNDDGTKLFDEVVDIHTICRYSPVFKSKAFICVTILSRSVIFIPFSVSSSNRSMAFFDVPLIRSLLPLASSV